MTRAQRIILVIYCLLVVYCAVWVPWVANIDDTKDIHEGYGWVWKPPEEMGIPSLPIIATRILAATALSGAAFLLARKWKTLLFVAALAGAGLLLSGYWGDWAAKRRIQKIHDCAVAKVATAKCTPPPARTAPPPGFSEDVHANPGNAPERKDSFEVLEVCSRYALSGNPTAQEE